MRKWMGLARACRCGILLRSAPRGEPGNRKRNCMSDAPTVRIAIFGSDTEAHIARSLLESNGIPCFVATDDCGGMRAHLQLTTGVRLIARKSDAERATRILAEVREENAQRPPSDDEE